MVEVCLEELKFTKRLSGIGSNTEPGDSHPGYEEWVSALEKFIASQKDIEVGSTKTEKISTKEIKEVEEIDNTKTINFAKNQMKNTDQIKTYSEKDVVNNKKFEVRSFADLIYLAEKNKEMELKYDLERNVKLANFENGNIDINFNENINKNFIKKLSQSLFEWTGKRWIITISKNSDLKTFHEKKISNKEKLLSKVWKNLNFHK